MSGLGPHNAHERERPHSHGARWRMPVLEPPNLEEESKSRDMLSASVSTTQSASTSAPALTTATDSAVGAPLQRAEPPNSLDSYLETQAGEEEEPHVEPVDTDSSTLTTPRPTTTATDLAYQQVTPDLSPGPARSPFTLTEVSPAVHRSVSVQPLLSGVDDSTSSPGLRPLRLPDSFVSLPVDRAVSDDTKLALSSHLRGVTSTLMARNARAHTVAPSSSPPEAVSAHLRGAASSDATGSTTHFHSHLIDMFVAPEEEDSTALRTYSESPSPSPQLQPQQHATVHDSKEHVRPRGVGTGAVDLSLPTSSSSSSAERKLEELPAPHGSSPLAHAADASSGASWQHVAPHMHSGLKSSSIDPPPSNSWWHLQSPRHPQRRAQVLSHSHGPRGSGAGDEEDGEWADDGEGPPLFSLNCQDCMCGLALRCGLDAGGRVIDWTYHFSAFVAISIMGLFAAFFYFVPSLSDLVVADNEVWRWFFAFFLLSDAIYFLMMVQHFVVGFVERYLGSREIWLLYFAAKAFFTSFAQLTLGMCCAS